MGGYWDTENHILNIIERDRSDCSRESKGFAGTDADRVVLPTVTLLLDFEGYSRTNGAWILSLQIFANFAGMRWVESLGIIKL